LTCYVFWVVYYCLNYSNAFVVVCYCLSC